MKKLACTFLLLLGLTVLIFSLGCEGDMGLLGDNGSQGDPGDDAEYGAPDDMVFALAIFNGTEKDHNGAHILSLSFDSTATPSKTMVVGNHIAIPPVIDGIDDGSAVWGTKASTLELTGQAFADNLIHEASMRAAYDDHNVYFQVRWSEVKTGDFVVGQNDKHLNWIWGEIDTAGTMGFIVNKVYEDRLGLYFYNSNSLIDLWTSQGCLSACHEPTMRSSSSNQIIDLRQWGASRSDALGIALDRAVDNRGFREDTGYPIFFRNFIVTERIVEEVVYTDSLPVYMHAMQSSDQTYTSSDPLWEYVSVPYDPELGWNSNSVIPGWILQTPIDGTDLIKCKGVYSSGTWTVEFSRPRNTNDPYDVDF